MLCVDKDAKLAALADVPYAIEQSDAKWHQLIAYMPIHAAADTKEPVSLEKKTYENTTEKLGQAKQQQQGAPAGAQVAYA